MATGGKNLPPSFSFRRFTTVFSDTPEIGPGALIGTSGSPTTGTGTGATRTSPNPTGSTDTSSTHGFTSPPTPTPTPTATGGSNAGAIAGGVVGGIAAISIAAAALFFFLRRRQHQQAPQAATFVVDGPSLPHMDESRRPLSDNISFVPTSVPETPSTSMRLYVRAFHAFVAFVRACVLIFCTLRIQVTRLRSLDTNHLRPGRMYLTHRTETETTWPTCKYRGHLDITACPLFDFTSPFDFFCVGLREPGFTVFSGIYYVMGMEESPP
jgi:hypothetical protein